jgi:hypothetical protein
VKEVVLTAELVILSLKIAVLAVTALLLASLVALARGHFRLHGRLNMVFFALSLTALVGLELIARGIQPDVFREYFDRTDAWNALYVHLSFSIPVTILLPIMLVTGVRGRVRWHVGLSVLFLILWTGTFVTGVFFLPHQAVP